MVDAWLPYGNTEVCARIPTENLQSILEPKEKIGVENPQAEVENALATPLGTKRLAETAKNGDRVALVIKDSGVAANTLMVSSILRELNAAGTSENLTVIIAHDPLQVPSGKESPLLSEGLSSTLKVLFHSLSTSDVVKIGETSRGTKVYLNRVFAEANLKILASAIEPHPYAGYSGGRDCVLPGISNIESVQKNLALSLNPKDVPGALIGNPVHEDMVEAAQLARVDFSLAIVMNRKSEIVKAFAGEVNKAFDEGVKVADEMFKIPVEKRADILLISPGGSPLDSNLFEACKVLNVALETTRRGGAVVLVAECRDGCGSNEFYDVITKVKDPDALEKSLRKGFNVSGYVGLHLLRALQRNRVFLVSMMPEYYVSEASGLKTARTANEALLYAFDLVGKKEKVSSIPYGHSVIPVVRSG